MTFRLVSLIGAVVWLFSVLFVTAAGQYLLAAEVFAFGTLTFWALIAFAEHRSVGKRPIGCGLSQYARDHGVGRLFIETRSPPTPSMLLIRKLISTTVLAGVLGGGAGFLLAGNMITAAAIFIAVIAGALAVSWGGEA